MLEPQIYLSKFDAAGHRTVSVPVDITLSDTRKAELLADGYIEIPKEDWEYYIGVHGNGDNGTGYIRDSKTGKPVSAPAYVPTMAEKVAALDNQYETNKKVLANYYLDAAIAGDTDTQNALRAEMAALNEQYDADVKALKGE